MRHSRVEFRLAVVTVLAALSIGVVFWPQPGQTQDQPSELFFSEYVEGSSNNKALEIHNPGAAPVDLAAGAYVVQTYFNGATTTASTINLTGTVAPGDVFVLAQSAASPALLAQADQTTSAGWFNGDDAIVLRRGGGAGAVVDSLGQIGIDPGTEWGTGLTSTADNTLRRQGAATADRDTSDAFDPAAQWDGFAADTFDGLGAHGGSTPAPSPTATPTPTPTPTTPALESIGTVQGPTTDDESGAQDRSPFAPSTGNGSGQTVTVQGIVAQRTLSGSGQNGFFLQSTPATADADPNTSDGIFVFMNTFTTLIGGYQPRVGDEVIVRGRVSEFFNLTQLSSATAVEVVGSGRTVQPFEATPPDELDEAQRYWERHEGMQGTVPAGARVVDGRDVFGDPATGADAEAWVIRGDHPVAQRSDADARRVFRDPHPLDNNPQPLFDDGNGYRILLGSLGLKAAANDRTAVVAPTRTFDTVTNAATGGVYFSFEKYQIQPAEQLTVEPGVDPAANAAPAAPNRSREYVTSTYNVENLYDFRDDPNDGCDFAGNTGCPGVRPPFDYVPASAADYDARRALIARQITGDLHSPDVLLVQEAEDQDLCSVSAGVLECGSTDNADGKPDTLQELALDIVAAGGPRYEAVYDRDGADDRGIVSAFLYRTDRVELLSPEGDPVLGAAPTVTYRGGAVASNADVSNPKALNAALPADVDRTTGTDGSNVFTRAPQVGKFRVWRTAIGRSVFTDLYALSNHFSSGPDSRIGQRREQAAYNAAIVAALQARDPAARAVVGGDFNVYPRPDDPVQPPSDQLAPLYDQGLANLFDTLLADDPAAAYSYVFQGQTQTLDSQFATPSLRNDLVQYRVAHVNADWPAEFIGDGPRGLSDHDPSHARLGAGPRLDQLRALLVYFLESGQVRGGREQVLLDRLARAEQFLAGDQGAAAAAQLRALGLQARGLGPHFVSTEAADVIAAEAQQVGNVVP